MKSGEANIILLLSEIEGHDTTSSPGTGKRGCIYGGPGAYPPEIIPPLRVNLIE